jgi:hypothetical protein
MSLLQENISRIKNLMNITEGVAVFSADEKKHLKGIVDLIVKELDITVPVDIRYQTDKDGIETTAVYKYEDGENSNIENSEVKVYTKDRALQDVMRSVAHELVHHHQNEEGELEGKIQNVGGPIEDEANALAGEFLKKYGLQNPEIYGEEEFPADEEMIEQDEGGDTGGGTTDGGGDSSSTNAGVTTWETGLTRGPANQITITVWSDNVNRGKGNMIDQNSKWESGLNRGKSNTLT